MAQEIQNLINPIAFAEENTNLALHSQNALGFAQPIIMPWKNIVRIGGNKNPMDNSDASNSVVTVKGKTDVILDPAIKNEVDWGLYNLSSTLWQVPICFRLDSEPEDGGFYLPVDPLVAISSKNVISRRYVSKSKIRGTIKESWSQDDYTVSISGTIMSTEYATMEQYVLRLRSYCEAKEAVHITCDFINQVFGITRIAIESYEFPFTKGTENQAFTINAYSDDAYTLLEDV